MATSVLHVDPGCGIADRGNPCRDNKYASIIAVLAFTVVGPAGCTSDPRPLPMPSRTSEPGPGVIAVPNAVIVAALNDAAARTRTPQAKIRIVSAEAVTWPDSSLGCPQPGLMYAQALMPGYRVVLEAQDQTLNYHAGRQGLPQFCPAERVTAPVTGGYAFRSGP